jgi:hypothetical protein
MLDSRGQAANAYLDRRPTNGGIADAQNARGAIIRGRDPGANAILDRQVLDSKKFSPASSTEAGMQSEEPSLSGSCSQMPAAGPSGGPSAESDLGPKTGSREPRSNVISATVERSPTKSLHESFSMRLGMEVTRDSRIFPLSDSSGLEGGES